VPEKPRRTPKYTRFIGTGAVIGFIVGAAVAILGAPAPGYGVNTQLGYLGVLGAALGALVAGVVAVLLDRRP
jgi:hypothetical protein